MMFAPSANTHKLALCYPQFAEGPLVDGLYWETWYNERNVSEEELGYIFYENKLLGVPRLRQLKVISLMSFCGHAHVCNVRAEAQYSDCSFASYNFCTSCSVTVHSCSLHKYV